MNTNIYRFKLGDFHCVAVSDGTHTYTPPTFPPPATFLFANAPKERLEPVLREHNLQPEQWLEWTSPYICLAVNTGKHQVLVDTGADGLAPSTGKLVQNLKAVGIAPEHIDTVILTHGHPDHIGGNTDSEGKLTFPDARYVMWKGEWDFWTSGQAETKLDEHVRERQLKFARKNLPPIQGRLELVDRETFLSSLVSDLLAEGSDWNISDHCKIEWGGQPRSIWPEADILVHAGGRRFIIEYDEDSDPGRSLVKYWPVMQQGKGPLTIIEVWERGSTVGQGYAELAKWMAARLMEMYPTFDYKFVQRIDETSRSMAKTLTLIIKDCL